ncbi:MAG TPA: bacteriohopanetetrol glucosamine biosynthesis glycosyltransferase HpnI [Terriglobales bacterium]|nr:bacteriohopanetetrol glucosamine biosynthesis glycosyltransferase HpnI [Terriglobales bacterium]
MFLREAVLGLALGPFVYYLLTLWASSVYFRGKRRAVSNQCVEAQPVSILKPVRGLDREAYENFASFCRLDYPEYEVLFCVNSADDPAVPVIEKLQRDFPERNIRLLIRAPHLGASGKVNKLCRLVQEASHDLLVISDSDVRVEPNYLREVSAPFSDPHVGAVTVFFRSVTGGGVGATLDAAGSAVEFAASALLAQTLEGIHFTLGATMAVTKKVLAETGGFEALVNHYVDDYELGRRISKLGYRVELAATPVCMVYPRENPFQFLRHELRWTIGLRNVRPFGHAAIGLTLGFPWTVLAAWAAPTATIAWLYVFAYLALRFSVYLVIGVWGLGDPVVRRKWWLAPVRDAANFAVWVTSFFSNRISWRGLEFRVKKGILIPLEGRIPDATTFPVQKAPKSPQAEVLDGSLGRSTVLLEPAIDFAASRTPRCDLGLEKTHEVG